MKKVILILISIILFLPVYFMFTGSLQDIKGVMKMPPSMFPATATLINYKKIFAMDWPVWIYNTIFITSISSIVSVFVSCSGGYLFAFYKFPFKKILWNLSLIGIMIPRIAFIIPLYVIFNKLKLSGTLYAVMLPIILSPVGLYLAKTYFETIPNSLLESARLDGASEMQILMKIVSPVSIPIVSALLIFASIFALQDFIWQSLVLQLDNRQTLLVGLMRYAMARGGSELSLNPIGRSLAVGMILLLPLLLIFIIANKYFVSAVDGAEKG